MGTPTIPKRINISIDYSSFFERIKIPTTKVIIAIPPLSALSTYRALAVF
jgi:hypothetical protein